jgi:hypothetical protein
MLLSGYVGPRERWDAELEKVNRHGLIRIVRSLLFERTILVGQLGEDALLTLVATAKKSGTTDALLSRLYRMETNPVKSYEEYLRRSRAGKKAARRRKQEQRTQRRKP